MDVGATNGWTFDTAKPALVEVNKYKDRQRDVRMLEVIGSLAAAAFAGMALITTIGIITSSVSWLPTQL